jgi:2-(1,2-epoxy-1,2-dihydrophenyl)acetyl-CoA isomerase
LALRTLDKPYIAAVNGPAAGAGMDMASMAELHIASETVRFIMSYVNVGIVPGDGGCYYLPRIVGIVRALDLIWTGRTMDAQEALQIG